MTLGLGVASTPQRIARLWNEESARRKIAQGCLRENEGAPGREAQPRYLHHLRNLIAYASHHGINPRDARNHRRSREEPNDISNLAPHMHNNYHSRGQNLTAIRQLWTDFTNRFLIIPNQVIFLRAGHFAPCSSIRELLKASSCHAWARNGCFGSGEIVCRAATCIASSSSDRISSSQSLQGTLRSSDACEAIISPYCWRPRCR